MAVKAIMASNTFNVTLYDGDQKAEVRVTGSFQQDEAGFLHFYTYYDKKKGDPTYSPFSPHMLALSNSDPNNKEIDNADLSSGAMQLHINRLWYDTPDSQRYNLNLDCWFTDSEGSGKNPWKGILATFMNW